MSEIVLISKYSSESMRKAAMAVEDFNAGMKRLGQAAADALVIITQLRDALEAAKLEQSYKNERT